MPSFLAMIWRPLLCRRCGKELHECGCEDVAAH
jgi:hypothetical protein